MNGFQKFAPTIVVGWVLGVVVLLPLLLLLAAADAWLCAAGGECRP